MYEISISEKLFSRLTGKTALDSVK